MGGIMPGNQTRDRSDARLRDAAPRIATFFTAYPEPLGLPAGEPFIVTFGGVVHGYADLENIVLHYDGDSATVSIGSDVASTVFVSVRFHNSQRAESSITANFTETLAVVQKVAPYLDKGRAESQDTADERFSTYTVVELVTPVIVPEGDVWVPADPDSDVMGPTLTRCFDALRMLVDAYRLVENIPMPLPARERLGPLVIAGTRPADPAAGPWDTDVHGVINGYALVGMRARPALARILAQRIRPWFDHA